AAAPAPVAAAAQSAPAPSIDPASQVIAQLQDREVAYQQLIEQANQRLQQAYEQQKAMAAQINKARAIAAAAPRASQPAQAASVAVAAQPTGPTLSAESAQNIAIDASGGKWVSRAPQLVLFENKVAYEIGFTSGAIYVDANSGAVLYNGAVHASNGGTSSNQPPASSGDDSTEGGDN
ncbi:MAG TPA: PepSY domain-containing protein, partial [Anaerolineae bacterium]|nr:PepSY domain-containing protein [Anaerolineae bacterium]